MSATYILQRSWDFKYTMNPTMMGTHLGTETLSSRESLQLCLMKVQGCN